MIFDACNGEHADPYDQYPMWFVCLMVSKGENLAGPRPGVQAVNGVFARPQPVNGRLAGLRPRPQTSSAPVHGHGMANVLQVITVPAGHLPRTPPSVFPDQGR